MASQKTNKYRNILIIELDIPIHALRVKRDQHLPTVLAKNEVTLVLNVTLDRLTILSGIHKPVSPHTLEKMRYTPSRNDH